MTESERLQVLQNCFDYGIFCDCTEIRCKDDGYTEELVHHPDCDAVTGLLKLLEAME